MCLIRSIEELACQAEIELRSQIFEDIIGDIRAKAAGKQRAADLLPCSATGQAALGRLFAHAIHNASRWRRGQFVRVNCTAIANPTGKRTFRL